MTVQTRRGLATHGLRGLTGRPDRRLAVATQGVRGYLTGILSTVRNYRATIIGVYYQVRLSCG